jgi:acyl carrier protein
MDNIHARLTGTFRDIMDDESIVLRPDLTANDVEEWNFLSHINPIVAIEKEFRIRFTTAEVSGLKNVGELEALVVDQVNCAELSRERAFKEPCGIMPQKCPVRRYVRSFALEFQTGVFP